MKEKIESLKSESEAVAQLTTKLQVLDSRMDDLEAKGRCVAAGFHRTRWSRERTTETMSKGSVFEPTTWYIEQT